MKVGVIYARYSSDRQTDQSIDGQLRVCNDYAKKNEITIVNTYIDRAMTGTNDNRDQFQKMLNDSNTKAWDYVLVYKLDRFSRNKYEMTIHRKTLKDNGIKLISCMENIPDSPEGIILESLLEGFAEYYSAELSQKVKRGMNESREKGNITGGLRPLGYCVKDKKYYVNEEEAEIIRIIFDRYMRGKIIKDIIEELHSMGLSNRGKPFKKNTIHNILSSERYVGRYTFQGKVYTNIFPRIIDDETFEFVKNKKENNKYGGRPADVAYLLSRKTKCGYCGKNIVGITGTSKNKKVKRYYSCVGVYQDKICKKKNVNKDKLENIVVQALVQAFSNGEAVAKLANDILKVNEERIKSNSVLNLLKKERKDVQKAIDNIVDVITKGLSSNVLNMKLSELEQRAEELDTNILIESSKKQLVLDKTEITSFIKKALQQEPQKLVKMLIKEVLLFDDKIEIYCNYTPRRGPDGNPNQDLLFYKDIVKISIYDTEKGVFKDMSLKVRIHV